MFVSCTFLVSAESPTTRRTIGERLFFGASKVPDFGSLWGNAQTIEDVFNPRIVDDGVCSVTAFTHKHHGVLEPYYFWLARFGGNANGHVIRGDAGPSEEYLPGERCTTPPSQGLPLTYSRERVVVRSLLGGPWVAVAQNVDDDLTWTCPTNPAPEGFMERLRAVVERE